MTNYVYEIKQTLDSKLPDRLKINDWKGDSVIVDQVLPHTELFYEVSTGYIYCITQQNNFANVHALIIAFVDDSGEVKPTVQPSAYFLDVSWNGYKVKNPISFMAQLLSIEKAYYSNELCWKLDQYIRSLLSHPLLKEVLDPASNDSSVCVEEFELKPETKDPTKPDAKWVSMYEIYE